MTAKRVTVLHIGLVLLALFAAGCAGKDNPSGAAQPNPGAGPQAGAAQTRPAQPNQNTGVGTQPDPANPVATTSQASSVDGLDDATRQQLLTAIKADLKLQGKITNTDQFLFTSTKGVPAGYFRLVGVNAAPGVVLYGTNEAGNEVGPLGSVAKPGTVLMGASYDGTTLRVTGNTALNVITTVELQWDGYAWKLVSQKSDDPNAAALDQNAALIKAGDVEALMRGFTTKDIVHADTNGRLASQVADCLLLAYDRAMASYKVGDIADALRYMNWAVYGYGHFFGDVFGDTASARANLKDQRVPLDRLIPIINDYAFFQVESNKITDADYMLQEVIKYAPDRTVAYLNMGDAQWQLGHQEQAKPYYQKYLDLLGTNKAQAPARVAERLK